MHETSRSLLLVRLPRHGGFFVQRAIISKTFLNLITGALLPSDMKFARYVTVFCVLVGSTACFSQQQNACACCTKKNKEFNFWVGEWKVYNKDGKLAGENHIVVIQDSCVIQENWTSANAPFRGTSYNFYNTQTGRWQQLWVDNQGTNLQLEGGLIEGEMVLSTKEWVNKKGQKQIDRIKWTPFNDGSVRQLWESSIDGGNNWTVVFDGMYRSK